MIFLDTGPMIAYLNEGDRFYKAAEAGFEKLALSNETAFTTPLCIAEVVARIAVEAGDYLMAAHIGMTLLDWPIEIGRPTLAEEGRALVLMESYAQARRRVGYVDCVSFVMMDARGSRTACTFDAEHFVELRELKPWVPIPKTSKPAAR